MCFWPSVCFLWRNVYLDLHPFFDWVVCFLLLNCMSCLYIWKLSPCWSHHLQILSPILRVVFSPCLWVSFAVQKFLSFIRSHLFIFVFIFTILGGGSKKILLQFMSESVLLMFSSKSFMVSSLIFRSLIHFEFIVVCGLGSDLISFVYM